MNGEQSTGFNMIHCCNTTTSTRSASACSMPLIHQPGLERYLKSYDYMKIWIKKHRDVKSQLFKHDSAEQCSSFSSKLKKSPATVNIRQGVVFRKPDSKVVKNSRRLTIDPNSTTQNSKRKKKFDHLVTTEQENPHIELKVDLHPEFLDFMRESARHKKEREAKKALESKMESMEVDGSGYQMSEQTRLQAPTEQPGSRRTHEIKLLYGEHSYKIHGMETAQQLHFQQQCDSLQPLYWPNIPLNIKFS